MRRTYCVAASLAFLLLAGCGGGSFSGGNTDPAPQPDPDSISGSVIFKANALSGVKVTDFLTNSNVIYQTATTETSGSYSFTGMGTTGDVPGEYQVWARKTGYGFYPSISSGAKIERADYTGQFVQNQSPYIAIYFTVIDFDSLPNASITGADFIAYDGSNPLVSLAATGQQASYVAGDDAWERKGAAWPIDRFSDNNDGTVTDNLTGLIWLKNAACFASTTWSKALSDANDLASGACGLSDGSTAGQWRLPNLGELESLVDASAANPAIAAGSSFIQVSDGIYWSSTSYFGGEEGSPDAWAIRFSDGRYMNDSVSNVKATSNNAVWPVKETSKGGSVKLQATGEYVVFAAGDDGSLQTGVRLTYPRWIDNANGTVTDTMTGLIWLKQADCIHAAWSDAISTINSLAEGACGLTDGSNAGEWRMPNRNEMQSLSDRMETNHAAFFNTTFLNSDNTVYQAAIFSNFIETEFYWTSTTDAADPTEAWTVYSCDFGVYDLSKARVSYTLAVR